MRGCKKFAINFLCVFFLGIVSPLVGKDYVFTKDELTVVIPCIRRDLRTLRRCIEGVKKNIKNVNRIIVISEDQLTKSCEWFPESRYPFTKREVAYCLFDGNKQKAERYIANPENRLGWLYQQLLKLYAPFVIPDISSNVLVVDADVIFLKPVEYQTEEGWPLLTAGKEYHKPYFEHAKRLLPDLTRVYDSISGITHHMLFQRAVLEDLFSRVEEKHNKAFWKAFISCVSQDEIYSSGASEYEIYFNFLVSRTDNFVIRNLKWKNEPYLKDMKRYIEKDYDYVACHYFVKDKGP